MYSKDGKNFKILKVEPINFKLKSLSEQQVILEAYKNFLKSCNFNMQIIVQTDSVNIENHFMKLKDFKEKEPELADMVKDYENLIKKITKERESISRKFYIVAENKNSNINEKISAGLSNCGNTVEECSKTEILQIMKRYFKKSSGARKETKWV